MNDSKLKINWPFKRAYTDAGFTLETLAEQSKTNATYLCLFSRGKYNLSQDQLERIATVLNVKVGDLLDGS